MSSNGLGFPGAVEVGVGVEGHTAAGAAVLPWMGVDAPLVAGKSGGCGMCSALVIAVAVWGIFSFLVFFLVFFFSDF